MIRLPSRGSRAAFVTLTLAAAPLAAQTPGFDWENATEFSYVQTAGNSTSNTVGLKSSLVGEADTSAFKVEVGGIRASSSFTDRRAVGSPSAYTLSEVIRTERSAANYFARARYDRDVGVAFAFGGAGWERNSFAGFRHRVSLVGGLGKTWVEGDGGRFKTDLGATYTIQKDIEDDPTRNDGFGGVRATVEAARPVTSTAELATTVVVDERVRRREDVRVDWITSLSVSLTEGLAFKTSYQLLFDNDPALVAVPLFDGGGAQIGTVRTPSDKLDTFLTLSLVIKL